MLLLVPPLHQKHFTPCCPVWVGGKEVVAHLGAWGNIRVIWRLYGDNGKMETTMMGYVGFRFQGLGFMA